MKKIVIISVAIVVLLSMVWYGKNIFIQQKGNVMSFKSNNQQRNTPGASGSPNASKSNSLPAMTIDTNKTYLVVLHTDVGNIKINLHAKETPVTVNNFVSLSKNKFYDGTIFHRVIKDFMIQGGDPEGTGRGGPGYRFNDEKFIGEYTRGTVAMANAGPNTNGSQFFIIHKDYQLPKNYVIFGTVTEGMETVDAIANSDVKDSGSGESSSPIKPIKILTTEVVE